MVYNHTRTRRAFSLIELVIVVVIIGIIGAIAIPRMSRGAEGAADSALVANLAILRGGLDMFMTEHGGYKPTLAQLPSALTMYSDEAGTTYSATRTATEIYGPYVRTIPPLPVGPYKGQTGFLAAYGAGGGWVYDATNATIKANTDPAGAVGSVHRDAKGKLYSDY